MKSNAKKNGLLKRAVIRIFYGPQLDEAPGTPARAEPVLPAPRSRVNDGDAYAALAPERLDAEWNRQAAAPRRGRAAVQRGTYIGVAAQTEMRRRGYEERCPDWMREALNRADAGMAGPITEMRRFVARCHGLPVERRDWETPQYQRRHADAMADTGEVLRRVAAGDVAGGKELIMAGARRASSTEITGMIQTVPNEVEQDPRT